MPEYNEGNGKRKKPKAIAVTRSRKDGYDGDGATGIEDVKLFLKRNPRSPHTPTVPRRRFSQR